MKISYSHKGMLINDCIDIYDMGERVFTHYFDIGDLNQEDANQFCAVNECWVTINNEIKRIERERTSEIVDGHPEPIYTYTLKFLDIIQKINCHMDYINEAMAKKGCLE